MSLKNIFSLLFCLLAVVSLKAQETTNFKGSNYKFKKINHYNSTPVESQGKTGTCWSFSTLSFLESELIRMGEKSVEPLSEMYIVRKAYEMKAEKYIRMDGKTNFGEGGAFHDIPRVIEKYGIVPRGGYSGNSEDGSYNHKELYDELNLLLIEIKKQIGKPHGIDNSWKKSYNKILDKHLGEIPQNVLVDTKKMSPIEYSSSLGLNMDNYVSLTSFSNHEFNESCMLEIPDNWAWGTSYNLTIEDLYNTAIHALNNGYTFAWGADVSEKGFSFKKGIAVCPVNVKIFDELEDSNDEKLIKKGFNADAKIIDPYLNPIKELSITQESRQKAYDNKTTTDDHGMHITGLYEDQNGTKYFYVKNSWGNKNYPEGYLYASENYFKYKTINIFLHKDAIPIELKDKLKIK